jgi:prolipoprotein diacylglyceryltransferase
MRRVLLTWHGISIYSYPALLYAGLVLGFAAGNVAAHQTGMNTGAVFVATVLLMVPALVGSRLLFVANHWPLYRREPGRIWRRAEGGAALYGGLILALAVSPPLLAALHLPFGAFWDVGVVTALVGMVCTRVGCLMNGCCAGRPSEHWLALQLPDQAGVWQRRYPTQLLEAGLGVALLVGVAVFWSHRPFAGAAFLLALAGYALGRFALQPLRAEESSPSAFFVYRAISVALVSLALVGVVIWWPR